MLELNDLKRYWWDVTEEANIILIGQKSSRSTLWNSTQEQQNKRSFFTLWKFTAIVECCIDFKIFSVTKKRGNYSPHKFTPLSKDIYCTFPKTWLYILWSKLSILGLTYAPWMKIISVWSPLITDKPGVLSPTKQHPSAVTPGSNILQPVPITFFNDPTRLLCSSLNQRSQRRPPRWGSREEEAPCWHNWPQHHWTLVGSTVTCHM